MACVLLDRKTAPSPAPALPTIKRIDALLYGQTRANYFTDTASSSTLAVMLLQCNKRMLSGGLAFAAPCRSREAASARHSTCRAGAAAADDVGESQARPRRALCANCKADCIGAVTACDLAPDGARVATFSRRPRRHEQPRRKPRPRCRNYEERDPRRLSARAARPRRHRRRAGIQRPRADLTTSRAPPATPAYAHAPAPPTPAPSCRTRRSAPPPAPRCVPPPPPPPTGRG